jgi:hypothetical protein
VTGSHEHNSLLLVVVNYGRKEFYYISKCCNLNQDKIKNKLQVVLYNKAFYTRYLGATTLSITTLRIMALSITIKNATLSITIKNETLSIILMLSVIMMNVF